MACTELSGKLNSAMLGSRSPGHAAWMRSNTGWSLRGDHRQHDHCHAASDKSELRATQHGCHFPWICSKGARQLIQLCLDRHSPAGRYTHVTGSPSGRSMADDVASAVSPARPQGWPNALLAALPCALTGTTVMRHGSAGRLQHVFMCQHCLDVKLQAHLLTSPSPRLANCSCSCAAVCVRWKLYAYGSCPAALRSSTCAQTADHC